MRNINRKSIYYLALILVIALALLVFAILNRSIFNRFLVDTTNPPRVKTENEMIKVSQPEPYQTVSSPFDISGQASVFEAVLNYRLKDSSGNVLADGFTMTAEGFAMSPFSKSLDYADPQTDSGVLEVFAVSPKDGSEINKISIPVSFKK